MTATFSLIHGKCALLFRIILLVELPIKCYSPIIHIIFKSHSNDRHCRLRKFTSRSVSGLLASMVHFILIIEFMEFVVTTLCIDLLWYHIFLSNLQILSTWQWVFLSVWISFLFYKCTVYLSSK
jgi:hypothetical protein